MKTHLMAFESKTRPVCDEISGMKIQIPTLLCILWGNEIQVYVLVIFSKIIRGSLSEVRLRSVYIDMLTQR